jgi:hypothetical protein
MRSYLVLTPPDGPDRDHRSTLVLRDGFSWAALFFPWLWLLWNRLWLAGIVALALQAFSGFLMSVPQWGLGGGLSGFAISLLVALEGRHYRSEALIRRGWRLETVVSASTLDAAEEIYFGGLPEQQRQAMPALAEWVSKPAAAGPTTGWNGPHTGLFDHQGGR